MARAQFGNRAITRTVSAPVGGWNARDGYSEMKPNDAIILDNLIPGEQGVRQRRGVREHATDLTGHFVETLAEYNAAGSNPKMFACTPNIIYDVSASGSGVSSATGLSNGRWQNTMFATTGGSFLVMCNGTDPVRYYDGSTWTEPTITGSGLSSSSSFINVTSHMSRLWFVQQASLKVWYLDTGAIAGTAVKLDLAPLSTRGGELVAMASWSRDGGSGLDDFAVFVTTKGELFVYQGTDPASAETWAKVGTFDVPEPIGRRCFIKLGADLCYLSSQGVMPLPQFLAGSSAEVKSLSVTDKIRNAFQSAYLNGGTLFGFQVLEYKKEGLLIVNIPIRERGEQHQYVMNLATKAWCRFKGLNAGCFGTKGDTLYFGGNDGKVYAYGLAGSFDDVGEPINSLGIQAYSNYGIEDRKKFLAARPLIEAPTGYLPQLKMLTDFDVSLPSFSPVIYDELGPAWDEVDWDVTDWGDSSAIGNKWQPVKGIGTTGALAMSSALTAQLSWNQTSVQFELGRAR